MKKTIFWLGSSIVIAVLATGCGALRTIAPLPQPTALPTLTITINTPTPLPPMGTLEYLDAAYCLAPETENIDAEYNILSFFPNGVVLEMTVQGYAGCQDSWDHVAPYLSDSATDTFSHGEYQLSSSLIQFWLAPAGSDEAAGIVTGRYEGDKMILQRQGAEMEYILVYGGQ